MRTTVDNRMSSSSTDFWDRRFSQPGFAYGREPNRFLRRRLGMLTPGRLLLPAEGEGRNAVWAASRGWQVTALDASEVARRKALELARTCRVEIDYRCVDLSEGIPEDLVDLDAIALIFAHMPREVRRRVHRQLAGRLKVGGEFLVEAFAVEQLGRDSGGPQQRELLVSADDLTADVAGVLRRKAVEEIEVALDEGSYHQGAARVVRLVAVAA